MINMARSMNTKKGFSYNLVVLVLSLVFLVAGGIYVFNKEKPDGRCGDGVCGPIETQDKSICPQDCDADTVVIGDNNAATGETGETGTTDETGDIGKDINQEAKIPYYVVSVHNEPYYMFSNHDQLMDVGYKKLKEMVDKANGYNIKLTLMFTPPWADYILNNAQRSSELENWKKQGHEIAAHHHGLYHGNWDGYSGYSMQFAESERAKKAKNESYLGTLDDFMNKLKKMNPGINSGCVNESEDMNDMPDEIIFATCSGFGNFGDPGRAASDFSDPDKARNEYVTEGSWNGITRKWLTHFYVGKDNNLRLAKEEFSSTPENQVFSGVSHSDNADGPYLLAFLDFLHAKDPQGERSRTLSQAIKQNLLPKKTIAITQHGGATSAYSETSASSGQNPTVAGKCGDGVCGPIEMRDKSICPQDCK